MTALRQREHHVRQFWEVKDGFLINRDDNIMLVPQQWILPQSVGYIEREAGVLEVRTDELGDICHDRENHASGADVIVAPKKSPIPDSQEWEVLPTNNNGYFHIRHFASRLLLTCQTGGNMTVFQKGKLAGL